MTSPAAGQASSQALRRSCRRRFVRLARRQGRRRARRSCRRRLRRWRWGGWGGLGGRLRIRLRRGMGREETAGNFKGEGMTQLPNNQARQQEHHPRQSQVLFKAATPSTHKGHAGHCETYQVLERCDCTSSRQAQKLVPVIGMACGQDKVREEAVAARNTKHTFRGLCILSPIVPYFSTHVATEDAC